MSPPEAKTAAGENRDRPSDGDPADPAAENPPPASRPESRKDQAESIVRRNVYWALGLGLVPLPLVDLLTLTAVQVKMLKELSDLYEQPFLEGKAQKIVGSLVASLGSLALTEVAAASLIKLVPFVGHLVGAVGVPLLAGTLTLAIGRLFVMHFESGGTLLTFDAEKMRSHFRREFAAGRDSVQKLQKQKSDIADLRLP